MKILQRAGRGGARLGGARLGGAGRGGVLLGVVGWGGVGWGGAHVSWYFTSYLKFQKGEFPGNMSEYEYKS